MVVAIGKLKPSPFTLLSVSSSVVVFFLLLWWWLAECYYFLQSKLIRKWYTNKIKTVLIIMIQSGPMQPSSFSAHMVGSANELQ